jgi:SAM-dependent methyltransferase
MYATITAMKTREPKPIPPAPTVRDYAAEDEIGRAAKPPAEDDAPPAYDDKYYDALHAGAVRSAAAVVPFVQNIVAARRVVDLGCGTGAWLAAFQAHGATRILGVDLPPLDAESPPTRVIPSTDFLAWDLTKPLKIKRRFDLALSLEVGEHLPLHAADNYLDSLVRLAPVVLFSAAIPDQGGEHHDNEQWPAWWAAGFKDRGYLTFDCLRAHFWDDLRVETWYAQNMLLFVRETDVERYPNLPKSAPEGTALPQALVHPRWWVFAQQQHRAVEQQLHETETGRWKAETALHAAEERLHETETGRWEAETALHATKAQLHETEVGRQEAETVLRATEEHLRKVESGWQEAETALDAAEERLREIEVGRQEAETALNVVEERLRAIEVGWQEAEEIRAQYETAMREAVRATRQHLARSLVGIPPAGERPRALIIIPGSLNYFYDQAGQRIAEALTNLGFSADVRTLGEIADPVPRYDCTFVINIAETILAYSRRGADRHQARQLDPAEELLALTRLAAVRAAVGGPTAAVQLDCVQTWWFTHACELCDYVGIPTLLDLGFHDQSADLTPTQARLYSFVFNGLTESERESLDALDLTAPRSVPWVFVGHMTEDRVRLVQRIMSEVDLRGFVYMPTLAPFTASGPHLNEQQLMSVLGQARYQIWCAHHSYFYLESERFRQSVLAGAVPIKLLTTALPPGPFPFPDFVLDEETFPEQLRAMDFPAMQQRAIDEFKALPALEEGLLSYLAFSGGARMAWAGRRRHAMGAHNGS